MKKQSKMASIINTSRNVTSKDSYWLLLTQIIADKAGDIKSSGAQEHIDDIFDNTNFFIFSYFTNLTNFPYFVNFRNYNNFANFKCPMSNYMIGFYWLDFILIQSRAASFENVTCNPYVSPTWNKPLSHNMSSTPFGIFHTFIQQGLEHDRSR